MARWRGRLFAATSLAMAGIAMAGMTVSGVARAASVSGDVVKIGVMNDQHGPGAEVTGPGSVYAARLATGVNVTAVGMPLTVGANGQLILSTNSSRVVAYSDEIYNNNTGSPQLIQIRPAGSQSRQNPA